MLMWVKYYFYTNKILCVILEVFSSFSVYSADTHFDE